MEKKYICDVNFTHTCKEVDIVSTKILWNNIIMIGK